ncbi:MAG: hypothetical protein ABUT20_36935 [Bacteroidota bacterium]
MQTRFVKGAAFSLIAVLAIGCATTNQYVGKLFNPRTGSINDSGLVATKFLTLDSLEDKNELVIDKSILKNSDSSSEVKPIPIIAATKPLPIPDEPIAKTGNPDGTRTKKTRE